MFDPCSSNNSTKTDLSFEDVVQLNPVQLNPVQLNPAQLNSVQLNSVQSNLLKMLDPFSKPYEENVCKVTDAPSVHMETISKIQGEDFISVLEGALTREMNAGGEIGRSPTPWEGVLVSLKLQNELYRISTGVELFSRVVEAINSIARRASSGGAA